MKDDTISGLRNSLDGKIAELNEQARDMNRCVADRNAAESELLTNQINLQELEECEE